MLPITAALLLKSCRYARWKIAFSALPPNEKRIQGIVAQKSESVILNQLLVTSFAADGHRALGRDDVPAVQRPAA